jgi:hypothetical protein
VFVNGAYLMCCVPLRIDEELIAFGVSPMIEAISLVSYQDVLEYFTGSWRQGGRRRDTVAILTAFVGTLGYAIAGVLLTQRAFARFDVEADRPKRTSRPQPAQAAPAVDEAADGEESEEPAADTPEGE